MKIQHILIAFLVAIGCFAAGFWLGPQYAVTPNPYLEAMRDSDPDRYRIKPASEDIVLDGDAAVVRAALVHADPLVRASEIGRVLSKLGPESIDEVREAFDTVFLDVGDIELVLLADWWARFDPHAALEWSETDWRAAHSAIVAQILRAWGRTDPGAAMTRAQQGRGPKQLDKRRYQLAVIAGWEATDPLAALVYLQTMPAGLHRQRMMRGFARRRVFRFGIEDAFNFAESLPDGDQLFKLNLMRRVVSAAANIDAPLTAKLAASLQGGPYFRDIPQRIVIPWVRSDNALAAVAWLKSLEESDSRDNGVREAYASWLKVDTDAAINWVVGTEHEAWRDHALAPYARYVQLADRDKGVALAEMIVDDALRQRTLTLIVRVWARFDRDAAETYVEQQGWTQKERDRALAVAWRQRAYKSKQLEEEAGIATEQIKERMERDVVESDLEDRPSVAPETNE